MMNRFFFLFFLFFGFQSYAGETVWKGIVAADGTPTALVDLKLHQKYQIKVSGFMNLGKWTQNREKLANDACFEFNNEGQTEKITSFRNSIDVSVCDGKYHSDHIYESKPFVAEQNRIHFWVYDTDYEDNHGEFNVEVFRVE